MSDLSAPEQFKFRIFQAISNKLHDGEKLEINEVSFEDIQKYIELANDITETCKHEIAATTMDSDLRNEWVEEFVPSSEKAKNFWDYSNT